MAKPKKAGGPKQKLSPKAAAAKAARDKRIAMTPERRKKKAQNQRLRRGLKAKGVSVKGKDIHHTPSGGEELISTHANRGNYGKGTKKESPLNRTVRKFNID